MPIPLSDLPPFSVGFEIEHDEPGVATAAAVVPSHFGVIKGDGSVPDGFELESRVFSNVDFTGQTNLEAKWDALFASFAQLHVEPVDYAGHHIHIGYNALTPQQLHGVAQLIAANKQVTVRIAERNYDLSRIRTVQEFATNSGGRAFVHSSSNHGNGVHTTEFRFFQTQSNIHGFLKNMQYVISICDFIRGEYIPLEQCNTHEGVRAYLEFVSNNAAIYPSLHEFCQSNDFFNDCFISDTNSVTISKFTTLKVAAKFREIMAKLVRISEVKPYVRREALASTLTNTRLVTVGKAPRTMQFIQQVVVDMTAAGHFYVKVTDAPKKVDESPEKPLQTAKAVVLPTKTYRCTSIYS